MPCLHAPRSPLFKSANFAPSLTINFSSFFCLGESITAQGFPALDINDLHKLGLSFGARKVLEKLLHEV